MLYTEEIINSLVTISTELFEYEKDDYGKIKDFYKKAFQENRFMYLYKDKQPIGYLIFYLFNKNDMDFMLSQKNSGFDFPEHKKDGEYFYVEDCVIFKPYKNLFNLLYLRKIFREIFPQIKEVCWHKSKRCEKRIFNIEYHGGLKNAQEITRYN